MTRSVVRPKWCACALKYLIQLEQRKYFAKEFLYLINKKSNASENNVSTLDKSKIVNLQPILDADDILRVGGRIGRAECNLDKKHPIIIPNQSKLCYLLIHQVHELTHHGSNQVMMQVLRERYWIPHLRTTLRAYLHKCLRCVLYSKKYEMQLMSELPKDRVQRNRAFLITGVDYAGPIDIAKKYKRKTNLRKCWIAMFVCLVTRAIHIDVVTDLTSAAFIACFERFISRRGHCNKLYSDNGTTFRGANHEIRKAFDQWHVAVVKEHLNKKGTEWRFAPPAAPHQGGIYEAAVKSMKHHLYRVMGKRHYTYEYLITILVQIEAVLNSRPLYALSDDPMDYQAITPGHFLIGEPFILPPPIFVPPQTNYSLKRIREEHHSILEQFWKLWNQEYLIALMQRKKWVNENRMLKLGQLVAIHEENLPPAQWVLGRIVKLISSADGLIRSVEIKTPKSSAIRPVQKICVLPTEQIS